MWIVESSEHGHLYGEYCTPSRKQEKVKKEHARLSMSGTVRTGAASNELAHTYILT